MSRLARFFLAGAGGGRASPLLGFFLDGAGGGEASRSACFLRSFRQALVAGDSDGGLSSRWRMRALPLRLPDMADVGGEGGAYKRNLNNDGQHISYTRTKESRRQTSQHKRERIPQPGYTHLTSH